MSARIDATFAASRRAQRPVLVAYLCVGDPTVEASFAIAKALVEAGADILELGSPFSDPTADGPTIARASQRAIAAGGSMRTTLALGRRLRAEHRELPLVLFGYTNPIIVAGERATACAVADAGLDAILAVDLPAEEGAVLRAEARSLGLDVIPLLTPTSAAARIEAARPGASGFIYYVSVTGVTGTEARAEDPYESAARSAAKLRSMLALPVVVGFGIDETSKARRACGLGPTGQSGADGVVIGSAIVRAIEEAHGDIDRACRDAASVVRAIRVGLDAPPGSG